FCSAPSGASSVCTLFSLSLPLSLSSLSSLPLYNSKAPGLLAVCSMAPTANQFWILVCGRACPHWCYTPLSQSSPTPTHTHTHTKKFVFPQLEHSTLSASLPVSVCFESERVRD